MSHAEVFVIASAVVIAFIAGSWAGYRAHGASKRADEALSKLQLSEEKTDASI